MDLRVLQYFLAVAREQSISGAAQSLNLSQPTLSTQLKNLEKELGKQLLIRGSKGSRKVTLTEEGMLLRKRAAEILNLVEKTETDIRNSGEQIAGEVSIGSIETEAFQLIAKAMDSLRADYPKVSFSLYSANTVSVMERLEKGLIDFGMVFEPGDPEKYESLRVPMTDRWGLLLKKDDTCIQTDYVRPEDLQDLPLIIPSRASARRYLENWMLCSFDELNVIATYNLIFNASIMVDEGVGTVLTTDTLLDTERNNTLVFKPLFPPLESQSYVLWKKYQVLTKASLEFLDRLDQVFQESVREQVLGLSPENPVPSI